MTFRRPKSLKNYSVHARVKTDNGTVVQGSHQCSSTRCEICRNKNFFNVGDKFISHATGQSYNINYNLDFNSNNVIYLLGCKMCGK